MTAPAHFDLVVCGGGITGVGIARDAALRGLRVALVEKGDLASGTSSRSSKLVHGGLRYLEQGELALVFEGTNERALQMKRAPHLVRPVPFLVPIYQDQKPGLEYMNLGLWLYDALAMFRSPRLHKTYRGKKGRALEPCLDSDRIVGGIEYYDCYTDDARLTLENALDAAAHGAEIYTYTRAVAVQRDETGRVTHLFARDEHRGRELCFSTSALVVAGGPWTDELLGTVGTSFGRTLIRPTKGVHIVVDYERLPLQRAMTLFTKDNRVVFCLPWVERTVIGTTDTDYNGSLDAVAADAEDVMYLCARANEFFPRANLSPRDVLSTWAGLRPLITSDASRASDVSREHELFQELEEGVIAIAGGKLTTYRRMAKQTVDAVLAMLKKHPSKPLQGRKILSCRTQKISLPGAVGIQPASYRGVQQLALSLEESHKLSPRVSIHLAESYGERAKELLALCEKEPALQAQLDPELPYLWAEVVYAVQVEWAKTLEDVLMRRVPLGLRARDQGLAVAMQVASRMGRMLSWSDEETKQQARHYEAVVALTRQFRSVER